MPEGGWAARGLLTGLYLLGGVAAAASLASTLVEWAQDLNCLPPVTNSFGDPVSVKNALGCACDVITYGSGVVCGLCVMLAVAVNCCWDYWGWFLCHQTLTLLMCTLSAICGTALTVDFVLWCHTLQNTIGESSCESAASRYDQDHHISNMTAYFRKMEVQQACQWAVVPFLLCAVVVCSCVMKASTTETRHRGHPATGHDLLLHDESSPLIVRETSLNSAGTSPRAGGGGPSHASG